MSFSSNTKKMQSILEQINALPDASSGAELPVLTNPASAAQILTGYDAINQEGLAVPGSMPVVEQATPSISISENGLITAEAVQEAGYVAFGGKTEHLQLPVVGPKDIDPVLMEGHLIIAKGQYVAGDIRLDDAPLLERLRKI